jgi:hypothetical protein
MSSTPAVVSPLESHPPQAPRPAVAVASSPVAPSAGCENSLVKAKREQRVSIAEDTRLVETVVNSKGRFQFAVSGKPQPIDFVEDSGEEVDPPFRLRDLWETGVVKFPSGFASYDSPSALLEENKSFIRRYASIPEEWLEIISLYVLMTWVYDRFTAVPYLRFLGEPGTGKSRLEQICAAITYKAIAVSGNITGPALFRTIHLVRGTMVVDEADFKESSEWSEIIKVLNNGYTISAPVIRCGSADSDFTPQAFYIYGPKIISTRSRFADEALETRCLTYETCEHRLPAHIPLQLPRAFEQEALALRNKLLKWRFDGFRHIHAREDGLRGLSPRSGQIGASLAAVAPTEESRQRLIEFLQRYDTGRREGGDKHLVLQALSQLRSHGNSIATVGDVAKAASGLSEDLGGDELSPKRVGGILRSLGFTPHRTKSGYVINLPEPDAGGEPRG